VLFVIESTWYLNIWHGAEPKGHLRRIEMVLSSQMVNILWPESINSNICQGTIIHLLQCFICNEWILILLQWWSMAIHKTLWASPLCINQRDFRFFALRYCFDALVQPISVSTRFSTQDTRSSSFTVEWLAYCYGVLFAHSRISASWRFCLQNLIVKPWRGSLCLTWGGRSWIYRKCIIRWMQCR